MDKPTDNDVLRRLQKLLTMARGVANEHEAALAAERAAELLARHNLTEAEITLDAESPGRERIVEDFQLTSTRKRVTWHAVLATAAAGTLGCHAYWLGGVVCLLGRETAVQAAAYTCRYLFAEVTRLCDAHFEAGLVVGEIERSSARAWKNAFRIGAANTIAERLDEQTRARRARSSFIVPVGDPGAKAMVRLAEDQAEVDAAYDGIVGGRRGRASRSSFTSFQGYQAGRSAAANVSLGGARAALGTGTPRLTARR